MEPIITDAHLPTNESGPYVLKISDAIARDPLPDMGRKMAKGKSSGGKCKAEHMGKRLLVKKSTNPDALKTLTAIKSEKRVGKIPATDFVPKTTP